MFQITSNHTRRFNPLRPIFCLPLIAFVLITGFTGSPVFGFDEFKDVMEKRYRLKSVSCKACHTDNKDKKYRNAFGKILYQELREKKIVERLKKAKAKGEVDTSKFKKQMTKEFLVALKKVEKKPITFLSLAEAGLLNGTRLDKNQVDIDSLTIQTISPEELRTPRKSGSNVIHGEIKQMDPDEDRPKKDQKTTPTKKPTDADGGAGSKPTTLPEPAPINPKHEDAKPQTENPKPANDATSITE